MPYVIMPAIPNLKKMLEVMNKVARNKRANEIATEIKKELEELIKYTEQLTNQYNYGEDENNNPLGW
jgi:hypothetical protein